MSVSSLVLVLTAFVIRGQVVDDQDQPIADCRVVIDTAGAVKGEINYVDHYHYPDVGKSTLTDQKGRFRFTDVEPNRRFSVVAYKQGFDGRRSDVFVGETETPTVKLVKATDSVADRYLRGAVIDEMGNPQPFAVMRVREQQVDGKRVYLRSSVRTMVSGADGIFALPMPANVDAASLSIESPGLAPKTTEVLSIDDEPALIALPKGGSVAGRVVHGGKPVADLSLTVRVSGNGPGVTSRYMKSATDSKGRFVFHHLPPGMPGTIATSPASWHDLVVPMGTVTVPGNEQVADLGDLPAVRGHRVQVRLVADEDQGDFENEIKVGIQNGNFITGSNKSFERPGTKNMGRHPSESFRLKFESEQFEIAEVRPWLQTLSVSAKTSYHRLLPQQDMEIELVVRKRGE